MTNKEQYLRLNLRNEFLNSNKIGDSKLVDKVINEFYDILDCDIDRLTHEYLYIYANLLRSKEISEEDWKKRFKVLEEFILFITLIRTFMKWRYQ